jgi:hypothetical protein
MSSNNSGKFWEFVLRNSTFVPSNHDRLIYEMPGFQRPPAWLKEIQPSNRTMATPQPISNGFECGHGSGGRSLVEVADLDVVDPSRILPYVPPYQRLPKSGLTDLRLLPSQSLRAQDTDVRVQPTDNPYHWEAPQSCNSNISTWAKASWTRTNEIVRQRAGILNRKAAVRRSRNDGNSPEADSTNGCAPRRHSGVKSRTHCCFSFGYDEKSQEDSSTTPEEIEEEDILSETITRVDSGILPPSAARTTRFHEELEERPVVARTFSEILGNEAFVPTALLEKG